jgi:hypothetical protein
MLFSDLIELIFVKITYLFKTTFSYIFKIIFYHEDVLHFIIQIKIFNVY